MKSATDAAAAAEGSIPEGATVATFDVTGMDCGSCAKGIKASLEGTDGVTAAVVKMEDNTVQVAYEPGKVTVEKLQQIVQGEKGKYQAVPRS